MVKLSRCDHLFCRPCTKSYISLQLQQNTLESCTCPLCLNLHKKGFERNNNYEELKQVFKDLLEKPVYEMFNSKVNKKCGINDKEPALSETMLLQRGSVSNNTQAAIAVNLVKMKFPIAQAIRAAKECSSLSLAVSYLQRKCSMCAYKFPTYEIISLMSCAHHICETCLKKYIALSVVNRTVTYSFCPVCQFSDIGQQQKDDVGNELFVAQYSYLQGILQKILEPVIYENYEMQLLELSDYPE